MTSTVRPSPGSLTALTDMPEIAPASALRQSRLRPRTQAYLQPVSWIWHPLH
jgi:hypothetical protein